jgi:hypothetical protein
MKTILLLIVPIVAVVGCSPPTAPAMKRMSSYDQIDEHYLKDVFVPNYTGSKLELSNAVSQLDEHWAEYRVFMQQVEAGKIPVTQGYGGRQSLVKQDDVWTIALYSQRSGLVTQFEKHKEHFPLIYQFYFNYTNGCLIWEDTAEDFFRFDEHGRVLEYDHK